MLLAYRFVLPIVVVHLACENAQQWPFEYKYEKDNGSNCRATIWNVNADGIELGECVCFEDSAQNEIKCKGKNKISQNLRFKSTHSAVYFGMELIVHERPRPSTFELKLEIYVRKRVNMCIGSDAPNINSLEV